MRHAKGTLALFVIALLVSAACGSGGLARQSTTPAGQATGAASPTSRVSLKWDLVLNVALTHPLAAYFKEFAEAVAKRTDGQLAVTIRPVNELPYNQDAYVQAVGRGSIAMANASAGFVTTSKAAALPQMPFLMRTHAELDKGMPLIIPLINKELADQGVKFLFYYSFPSQQLFGSGPTLRSLSDLQGRKVRSSSPEQAVFLQKFGATPVSLTSSEVPTALDRGVVTASITATYIAVTSKLTTYFKWAYIMNMNMGPSYIIVNAKAYGELPAKIRAVLDEEAARTQTRMLDGLDNEDAAALAEMKKAGIEIVEAAGQDIAAGTSAMSSYWTTWANQAGADEVRVLGDVRKALGK